MTIRINFEFGEKIDIEVLIDAVLNIIMTSNVEKINVDLSTEYYEDNLVKSSRASLNFDEPLIKIIKILKPGS